MDTDALIEALAAKVRPIPPGAVHRRLAAGLFLGSVGALLLQWALLGATPRLPGSATLPAFLITASYTLLLGALGLVLAVDLARPESRGLRWPSLATLMLLVFVFPILVELAEVPQGGADTPSGADLIGVPILLLLAVPLFAGFVFALRSLAPTRLRAAGAAAALASTGVAATICVFSEPTWPISSLPSYAAAIAIACATGALAGPRLLRW